MPYVGMSKLTVLLALFLLGAMGLIGLPNTVHAAPQYRVGAFPIYSQEGSTIAIVLTVSAASSVSTQYEFVFHVRDPSTAIWTSNSQQYTTLPGETEFSIIILFPSPEFPGGAATSLVGTYLVAVDQIRPVLPVGSNPVAVTFFWVGLVDKTLYQRTETVSIVATGYAPLEPVDIRIRTSISSTQVFSHVVSASNTGQVTDSWTIPKNTTITEDYVVTLTGTTTSKNPADAQGFTIQAALMSIPNLSSSKSTYQRTETMTFSFQPTYPSGEIASTGLGLVTLARPGGGNVSLPANHNSTTQTFVAKYKTLPTNQTGTWTASLLAYSYDDGFGNAGPASTVSTSPDLLRATFLVSIVMKSTFAPFEQIRFNSTIQYPDSTNLQAGTVTSTLSYGGGGYSANVPVIFDSGLQLWVGTYNPQGNEPSGGWSLRVDASDSAVPANNGTSTRAITIQNRPPIATFSSSTSNAPTGTTISFNATGSSDLDGVIVSYLWTFGDGSTGSGVIVSHSYATSGTYVVRLNATDNAGAIATATATMTITNRPPIASLTKSPSTALAGGSVSFDATSSSDPDGTIMTYTWDFGDGSGGSGATTSHSYALPGTFTVTLTVTDNNGSTRSVSDTVTVNAASQSGGNVSFPLYYFGIIAAALAAALGGAVFAFRRHKVTHARLKIDLEAVRSEAGRIENQEFFQSVKDQLKKDKDD